MNDNARMWVKALRDGKYLQTSYALRKEDRFCCLGVACDLYAKTHEGHGWNDVVDEEEPVKFSDNDETSTEILPESVRKWFGLSNDRGSYGAPVIFNTASLASLNDTGYTFLQIADFIESEPEGLFE